MEKEIILFDDENGKIKTNKKLDNWFTLEDIARIYGREKSVISGYIRNILSEELLLVNVTNYVKEENSKKEICYYSIDVVISVGYRVKSKNGILFRKKANKYIKKQLLKQIM